MAAGDALCFLFLVTVRVLWSTALPMSDCDEIHNYWEPLHLLLFGSGKQTWEYHPGFALRSWFFVWIYGAPAYALLFVKELFLTGSIPGAGTTFLETLDKPSVFYFVKIVTAVLAASADWYMLSGMQFRFGRLAARVGLMICAFSTGMTQAGASFLPSSFAMSCMAVAAGAWMRVTAIGDTREIIFAEQNLRDRSDKGKTSARSNTSSRSALKRGMSPRIILACMGRELFVGLSAVCLAAIVGWPFCILLAVPIALSVFVNAGVLLTIALAVFISGALCAILAAVDSHYYGAIVLSTWNIVKYNVFGQEGRGSHLYGVEPWHFFFQNLFLNFNLMFIVALLGPVIVWLFRLRARNNGFSPMHAAIHSSPFFVWFAFWLVVPHKEERFMAPAYPFIVISAATALAALLGPVDPMRSTMQGDSDTMTTPRATRRGSLNVFSFLGLFSLWAFCVLSTARTAGLWQFYGGAENTALKLHNYLVEHGAPPSASTPITVCMGKEWYKYPGSFFLPEPTALARQKLSSFPTFSRQYGTSRRSFFDGAASVAASNRSVRFGFLETSTFKGAMPKDWQPSRRAESVEQLTRYAGSTFNDLNKPNPGQWIENADAQCDFVFESTLGAPDPLRRELNKADVWTLLPELSSTVLNKELTPFWCRLGFVPGFSRHCAVYGNVVILKNQLRGW